MIKLFGKTETNFNSNGDKIIDAIKARVKKVDNGDFSLELETDLSYVSDFEEGRIVVAPTPQGEQYFRISNVKKTKNKLTTKALHVFFDSRNYLIADSYVVENNCNAALDHLNAATGSNLAGDMEIGYYGCNPTNRYDKWIWLDFDNSYEQLNNPETTATLGTRSLGTTTEQTTPTRSVETVTLKKGASEPIKDKTELQTILDDKTKEAVKEEYTEPVVEESETAEESEIEEEPKEENSEQVESEVEEIKEEKTDSKEPVEERKEEGR